jgi:hypothetical protein
MIAPSGQSCDLNPIVHLQSLDIAFCHSEKRAQELLLRECQLVPKREEACATDGEGGWAISQ